MTTHRVVVMDGDRYKGENFRVKKTEMSGITAHRDWAWLWKVNLFGIFVKVNHVGG